MSLAIRQSGVIQIMLYENGSLPPHASHLDRHTVAAIQLLLHTFQATKLLDS